MTKSKEDRIRRMKLQHQAEGYLELGLPQQALQVLGRLGAAASADCANGVGGANGAGGANSADVRTLYLQGEALRSLERYGDAIVPLRKVAELEPENVQVLLALGWCHKRTGRIDLAIEALETALAADNDEPLIRYNLACYHSVVGDKRNALAYLEQALVLDPNYRLLIDHEPDFDPLRGDPDFQAICDGSQTRG
ncbi:MAG: tetratricopeptide repeat protein [Thermoguttaceae bacterium]